MPARRFPKPWRVDPTATGYRVIDANEIILTRVYGQPKGAVALSDSRLTNDEARRISKLISRLPEFVELERDRNKAKSRRKPQPLRSKLVTIGDLIRGGKLLELHCKIADRSGISISIPKFCAYRSECPCPRWRAILSAVNAAPGTATPITRSGRGPMRGSAV
jgi:hypothetical protein